MSKRTPYFSWFIPVFIGLFCVFNWPVIVLAEDYDLSTLAISDEQGGANTNSPDDSVPDASIGTGGTPTPPDVGAVNSGEASFSTESNSGSENQFITGSSDDTSVGGEGNFLTLTNNSDASPEGQFTTTGGGGGGGGGGNNDNGGGGGGGGGGRRRTPVKPITPVIPALPPACTPYLNEYLKLGWNNNRLEVIKLQAFLRIVEKLEVPLNGVYDENTYEAVKIFQKRYAKDILTHWGISEPTGFVFITTRMAINNIYCQRSTATNLDLRGVYKNRTASTNAVVTVVKPVDNNLVTTSTTTVSTVAQLVGPLPESPKVVAAIGFADFWQNSCGWLNILLVVLAITFFILWITERGKRNDSNRAPPNDESPPDDYDGPQLFSS